ncbi:hypothetical protein PVAND_006644 [Polypedilum vanderplanki]|uniref:Uncharacterized protein n=1 Tax=Polypedilum vanderplanki TaxID=319348 RepID=A0A9J6C4L6_POLVA|nr:hypothetical protein PVAND_006644 [Polypedilum vanderplanki]
MKFYLVIFAFFISLSMADLEAKYAQLFEELRNDEDNTSGHEFEYFCIRKYVKESELLDRNFKLNPKKINTLGNCDQQIELAIEDSSNVMASDKGLSKQQKECVKEKFKKGSYFNAMAIIIVIGSIKELTQEELGEEKKKFIEEMKKMTIELNKCVESNKNIENNT